MMKIYKKKAKDILLKEATQLLNLTLKKDSLLRYNLFCTQNYSYYIFFLAKEKNKILGWGLLDLDLKDFMLFVDKNHRGKGIGSMLMNAAFKESNKRKFKMWVHTNNKNINFFKLHKNKLDTTLGGWN